MRSLEANRSVMGVPVEAGVGAGAGVKVWVGMPAINAAASCCFFEGFGGGGGLLLAFHFDAAGAGAGVGDGAAAATTGCITPALAKGSAACVDCDERSESRRGLY